MPDPAETSGTKRSASGSSAAAAPALPDNDQFLQRFAEALAAQNKDLVRELAQYMAGNGNGTRAAAPADRTDRLTELERRYELLRKQLAGPFDDEADAFGTGRVISVDPTSGPVKTLVRIATRNTGPIQRVMFGGDVEVTPDAPEVPPDPNRPVQLVTVHVPDGAQDGPVSVEADLGVFTSDISFTVTDVETGLGDPSLYIATPKGRYDR
jgi:hypothetical protein